MNPAQFFDSLSSELHFPQLHASREDYIRGTVLGAAGFSIVGLPLLLGYFVFLLRAQLDGADFLPPIEPEHIGDYFYEGVKYLSFILVFLLGVCTLIWGIISIQFAPVARFVAFLSIIISVTYLLPLTFLWFAKTGWIFPLSTEEVKQFLLSGISFEYMTVWMASLILSLLSTLLLTIFTALVVTLPIVFFLIWYQGVVYTRYLGIIEMGLDS